MYLGICWDCRKPSGRIEEENKNKKPQHDLDLKQRTLSDFLD